MRNDQTRVSQGTTARGRPNVCPSRPSIHPYTKIRAASDHGPCRTTTPRVSPSTAARQVRGRAAHCVRACVHTNYKSCFEASHCIRSPLPNRQGPPPDRTHRMPLTEDRRDTTYTVLDRCSAEPGRCFCNAYDGVDARCKALVTTAIRQRYSDCIVRRSVSPKTHP